MHTARLKAGELLKMYAKLVETSLLVEVFAHTNRQVEVTDRSYQL